MGRKGGTGDDGAGGARACSGDTYLPATVASRLPSENLTWTIVDSTKPRPLTITGVFPVTGPVAGSTDCTAYGGPTMPATLRHQRSSSHPWRQPPK